MAKRAMIHVDIEADTPEALADALGHVTDAAMNADARVVRVISAGHRYATEIPTVPVATGDVSKEQLDASLARERNRLGRAGKRLADAAREAKGKGVID